MKLSVLITFYQEAEYVDQALASVLGQETDFEWEILIGDDGSTDGTREKLEAWRRRYPDKIQLFVRERGPQPADGSYASHALARVTANRLDLLARARGEYFIFLDGDDFYTDPWKLTKQAAVLDDPANAGCVGCAHNVILFWDDPDRDRPMHNPAMRAQTFRAERYAAVIYFHPNSMMFRNVFQGRTPDIFRRLHFEDQHITFYMLNFGDIHYLPDLMAVYRQNSEGIWNVLDDAEQNVMVAVAGEIGRQLSPRFKWAYIHRHFQTRPVTPWLREHYRELASPRFDRGRAHAERMGARETLRWLNYGRLPLLEKVKAQLLFQRDRLVSRLFRRRHPEYFRPGGV